MEYTKPVQCPRCGNKAPMRIVASYELSPSDRDWNPEETLDGGETWRIVVCPACKEVSVGLIRWLDFLDVADEFRMKVVYPARNRTLTGLPPKIDSAYDAALKVRSIDSDFRIHRRLIRIGDSSELLNDASSGLGVQSFAIAFLAGFHRRSNMDQNKSTHRINHGPHLLADRIVWRDGSANRDSTVLGDFRRHVTDAANIDVAVLFRESKLRRKMLADKVAVKYRDRTPSNFEELG